MNGDERQTPTNGGKQDWLSEAVLVAALTVVGTAMGYCYELGQCHYFGIQAAMIRVDVNTVANALTNVLPQTVIQYVLIRVFIATVLSWPALDWLDGRR